MGTNLSDNQFSLNASPCHHERIKDMARQILMSGALMALLGVAIGAFGAHGLKPFLSEQMLAAFETGVRYHLIHALGMLTAGLSLAYVSIRQFRWAGWAFFLGIVLFSGSLYVMSISGFRALGIVTPFGGLCFIVGWGLLAQGYWRDFPPENTSRFPPDRK